MDLKQALRIVIDALDAEMADNPSRELADVSNFLEARYQAMESN